MVDKIKNAWLSYGIKHPGAAKWIREGGLFVIVSNLITVFKYILLMFLPFAFAGLPKIDFGFPGVNITLFGDTSVHTWLLWSWANVSISRYSETWCFAVKAISGIRQCGIL